VPVEDESPLLALARAKLHRLCGVERGETLLREALSEAGLETVRSPDDLGAVAAHLIERGGFAQAVGYTLQFQATLHGARRPPL
jgi:hypothetical protein